MINQLETGFSHEYYFVSILFFPFQLTKKRKVTIQDFEGRRYVSIREFYPKDGKELPSKKD
jgi:hypothetical protein